MSVGRRLLVRARGICSLVPVDLMRKKSHPLSLSDTINHDQKVVLDIYVLMLSSKYYIGQAVCVANRQMSPLM